MLHKIAEDTVTQRIKADRSIIAAYMQGTVMEAEFLLGGTADVDLVLVYRDGIDKREIVRLTNEVHLDICHHPRSMYVPARDLRINPWLGNAINDCKMLYDPQHMLDFTQASVRGLFTYPENTLERARPLLEESRQIWLNFYNHLHQPGPQQVGDYLMALERVCNALACLTGPPLTERRFLVNFPARSEAVGNPRLFSGLMGLMGGSDVDSDTIASWLPAWEEAYSSIGEPPEIPDDLHPHRKLYYLRAIEAFLEGDVPQVALWPLLRTWTQSVSNLPTDSPQIAAWTEACEQLSLYGEGFSERVSGLDVFLDTIEELFDVWAQEQGL
jgi:hypothetical protein